MESVSPAGMLRIGCGLSGHVHPLKAIEQVCEQVSVGLHGATPDLVLVFFSVHHIDAARAISYAIRRRLEPRTFLGLSAESVLGGDEELEQSPGISVFAASLPGVDLHIFRSDLIMSMIGEQNQEGLRAALGFTGALRGAILLADPFSVPINTLLPAIAAARPAAAPVAGGGARIARAPIIGGFASAGRQPGKNTLLLDDQLLHQGCVGLSLSGRVRIDTLVSQGCRPLGPPMVVTGGKGQIIMSLGGRPALQAISEVVEGMDDRTKQLMQRHGLFLGRAVNEYKARFGRDDFLIRPIVNVDRNAEAIAVGELMRVGQTVQLHVRDGETADEDMEMLLDMQRLHDPPAGALLFTCNGRGRRLFNTSNHDASAITHAFQRPRAGEEESKGGRAIGRESGAGNAVPLAGFFAFGEIGPVGDEVFVHGHTASAAFFRGVAPNLADV